MSPCPWRNDPGTTTGGHRLSSHPLRRWPRQRSLGELTGGQRWGALQLGGLGRAPPAPPVPSTCRRRGRAPVCTTAGR